MPEDNGKLNPHESYTNKYKKHVASNYNYKLVCIDDKLSKSFKSYLGEDAIYNVINSMIEKSTYCNDIMKKHFNKELVMTKKDNEDFENSTKCWISDHCYITGKYRGSAHWDCNINIKLNHKIHVVLHNLNNYDSQLIMQELGTFNFEINDMPNGLEKYISFNINNKFIFTDSFQF